MESNDSSNEVKIDKRIGNKFYLNRINKTGSPRKYETPEILLSSCVEYFNYIDENPLYRAEMIKSGEMAGQIVNVPVLRPYTIKGLAIFLGVDEGYFKTLEETHSNYITKYNNIDITNNIDNNNINIIDNSNSNNNNNNKENKDSIYNKENNSIYNRENIAIKLEESKRYISIITRIRDIIYNQKYEGAASNLFNATIISRDLNLMDSTVSKVEISQPQIRFTLDNEEVDLSK